MTEYFIMGHRMGYMYYELEWESFVKAFKEDYMNGDYVLLEYTKPVCASNVIEDTQGWDGYAQLMEHEFKQLERIEEGKDE